MNCSEYSRSLVFWIAVIIAIAAGVYASVS
jgi:hypothetical protein